MLFGKIKELRLLRLYGFPVEELMQIELNICIFVYVLQQISSQSILYLLISEDMED